VSVSWFKVDNYQDQVRESASGPGPGGPGFYTWFTDRDAAIEFMKNRAAKRVAAIERELKNARLRVVKLSIKHPTPAPHKGEVKK